MKNEQNLGNNESEFVSRKQILTGHKMGEKGITESEKRCVLMRFSVGRAYTV